MTCSQLTGDTVSAIIRALILYSMPRVYCAVSALVLSSVVLAGCVAPGVDETILPERIDYVCANNRVLPVARGADGRLATVRFDGKEVVLQRADSAAQEKYGNERYALYLDGERAMLEESGRVLFGPCTSPVPLPMAPRIRY